MDQKFSSLDAIRSASTHDLLHLFFGNKTTQLLADAQNQLRHILSTRPERTATRRLLAGVELARRAAIEELIDRDILTSPQAVRDFLRIHFLGCQAEIFVSLWLDAQHRVLAVEDLFRGTLAQTSVYPREVVKKALERNAAAVIFSHNHPSGIAEPSRADELLTTNLKQALALVDVRVLDHMVVAGAAVVSFAERGLI